MVGSTMEEDLLIRTDLVASALQVDPDNRPAVVPAEATRSDVVKPATPPGPNALDGSSGTAGAIGYLLRGGQNVYGRTYGVASNIVGSISPVTADGE